MKQKLDPSLKRTIKTYKYYKFTGVEIDLIAQAYKCFLSLSECGQNLLSSMIEEAIESDRENGLRVTDLKELRENE